MVEILYFAIFNLRADIAFFVLTFLLVGITGCGSPDHKYSGDLPEEISFNHDVQPILSDRCFACHGPDQAARQADLRLDLEEHALAELASGNWAIVPDNPKKSGLVERILTTDSELQMPPPESKLTLSERDKAILIKWIEQGAKYEKHWAFEAPLKSDLPTAKFDWGKNEIDTFIFAQLENQGLSPSPLAEKATLLRRVSFDLTGLPPTLEELDSFLVDDSPDAFEIVVDQLIASPSYGQRWAWEWLDLARYADTNGFQGDPTRSMWPWRDWVVDAINSNMPYDQFTIEQLAGDLLPDASSNQILATAFNRNHMYNGEGGRIPEETRVENVFDRVETLGTAWLGLTVNCSRCHDHKFDPLTQKEYFQFYDYFNQSSEEGGSYSGKVPPYLDLSSDDKKAVLATFKTKLDRVAEEVYQAELELFPRELGRSAAESVEAQGLIGENVDALKLHPGKRSGYYNGLLIRAFEDDQPDYVKLLRKLRDEESTFTRQANQNTLVMVMDERSAPRDTYVLTKGIYDKPTEEKASRNVPSFLPPLETGRPNNRLALAEWLVSEQNPLTARVTVNRFWQTFFGTGLVKTTEDFGVQGEKPSHPRLLDWLAVEFMESGWDVKALHKKIVMSAAYQQRSVVTPELLEKDPENRWLARGSRQRLPSWMIRDMALATSGLLVDHMGGPSVKPYQPEGIWKEASFDKISYEQDKGDKLYRRTLYTFWRRIVGPTSLFDNASRQTSSVKNSTTNTPLHALTTLNDITYAEAARVMATRVMQEVTSDDDRLSLAFRLASSRFPSELEKDFLLKRLNQLRSQYREAPSEAVKVAAIGEWPSNDDFDKVEQASFAGICSIILNLDEVISKQ